MAYLCVTRNLSPKVKKGQRSPNITGKGICDRICRTQRCEKDSASVTVGQFSLLGYEREQFKSSYKINIKI